MPRTSIYPNGIDGYSQIRVVRDFTDEIVAEDNNALRSAVIKIEQTLGIKPQSTFGTVDARITALELGAAAISAGKVKATSNDALPNFLFNKLNNGRNINLIENNDGGNETIEVETEESLELINVNSSLVSGGSSSGYIFASDGYDQYGISTGITELFYRDDYGFGSITQITDDGYLATASSLKRIGLFAQADSGGIVDVFGKNYIFAQNIGGVTELVFRDSQGRNFQITDDGYLSGIFTSLNVAGLASFSNNVLVKNNLQVDGYSTFNDNTNVMGQFDAQGAAVFSGPLTMINNQFDVMDNAFFWGNTQFNNGFDAYGPPANLNSGFIANGPPANFNSGFDAYGPPANLNSGFIANGPPANFNNGFTSSGFSEFFGNVDVNGPLEVMAPAVIDGYLEVGEQLLVAEFPFGTPPFTPGYSTLYGRNDDGITELTHLDGDGYQVELTKEGLVGLRGLEQSNIIYVGGVAPGSPWFNDYDGYDIGTRYDNFTDAINDGYKQAHPGYPITIICLDSGEYNEFLDVPPHVSIYAPNATLTTPNGTFGNDYAVTVQYSSSINFKKIKPGNEVGGILRDKPDVVGDPATIKVGDIILDGQAIGILNLDTGGLDSLIVKCNQIMVAENGFGIGNLATNQGNIDINISAIVLIGNNSYGVVQLGGYIFGEVGFIVAGGPFTGTTGIYAIDNYINLRINEISVETQINLQGGELKAFIGAGEGETIVDPGSDYRVTYAGQISPYSLGILSGSTFLNSSDGYGAVLVDAGTGNVNIELPPNENMVPGSTMIFKKVDPSGNNMQLDGYAGRFIDGAPSLSTNVQYTSYVLMNDGYQWWIV